MKQYGTSENRVSSADSSRDGFGKCAKGSAAATDMQAKSPLKDSGFVLKGGVTSYAERNAKPGAFSFNAKPKES
jgi:hypothetical protein